MKSIVLALGGNAILQPGQEASYESQLENVKKTATLLVNIAEQGDRLIITHGNGPQVGNILRQNEEAKDIVPPMPLHILNAETQGFIGYMMTECIQNEIKKRNLNIKVSNLITRVLVNKNDNAFKNPTKPIGQFYTRSDAFKLKEEKGWNVIEDSGRGWRRVVPSPEPIKILEAKTIKQSVENGNITIACGGGGIPVVKKGMFTTGCEAVIDKDLSGCKLAKEIDADIFMIVTDVENVYIDYGKPTQEALGKISTKRMREFLEKGYFGEGSMEPKVRAALSFASGGKTSIICSIEKASEAIKGLSGTIIS